MKLATKFGARVPAGARPHLRSGLAVVCLGLWMGLAVLAVLPARADDAANPYAAIPARNIFNLVPIPTNPPPAEVKPPDPPAKITQNGIMKLFGQVQALFKVAWPPKAGQPPQEQSYTMSEGDREDGIAVVKIDAAARTITFDNNGVTQTLPLVADTGGSGGGPVAGPGGGPGGFRGRLGGLNPGYNGRFPQPGGYAPGSAYAAPPAESPGASPVNSGGTPSAFSFEGAQAKLNSILNDPNHLSPEAQVIMMEEQRQELQAKGDPTADMIPPTELTDQLKGGTPGN
jgi:hypothetical protein